MRRVTFIMIMMALAVAATLLWARSRGPEWTTDSEAAMAEFQAAREAEMKFDHAEAVEHLERALKLDPEFVAAKLFLLEHVSEETREQRLAELRQADPSKLTERERFLYHQVLNRWGEKPQAANQALAGYLNEHPNDPYALSIAANSAWSAQEWEKARSLYQRLLEVDPNWVTAQNRLGYIAMAQGRFEEAERLFSTYAYIAPDQPNPHDSMAELLTLLGRYDEARGELMKALEARPGFCASYGHWLTIEIMSGNLDDAQRVVERAATHCGERVVRGLQCALANWNAVYGTASTQVWATFPPECKPRKNGHRDFGTMVWRAALAAGKTDLYAGFLSKLANYQKEMPQNAMRKETVRGILHHLRGLEAADDGDWAKARRELQLADDALVFWGDGIGLLKLLNLLDLARIEEHLGNEQAAAALRERVDAVNPRFLEVGARAPLYREWP